MGPQLLCAASELPLAEAEVSAWKAGAVVEAPAADGLLRHRGGRYFAAAGLDPHHDVDIRGTSGGRVAIVESDTGRLLGSTDAGQAPTTVHRGAVYLHQGETYLVDSLDLDDRGCVRPRRRPGVRDVRPRTHRHHRDRRRGQVAYGGHPGSGSGLCLASGDRLPAPGHLREVIDFVELDMPERILPTTAVMYTITPDALADAGMNLPGFRVHCMPPNTRPSGCCHWWPAATEVTSVACPPRSAKPACRRCSSTTVISGAGFAEPITAWPRRGYVRLSTRSGRVNARTAARHAFRSRNAGTATIHWTKAGAVAILQIVLDHLGSTDAGPRPPTDPRIRSAARESVDEQRDTAFGRP